MITEAGQVADNVAQAALSVPDVTGLHPGPYGGVGTYLPGRRVTGVRLGEDLTEVHVIVSMDADVLLVAEAIRQAVEPLVPTGVDVFVGDVEAS